MVVCLLRFVMLFKILLQQSTFPPHSVQDWVVCCLFYIYHCKFYCFLELLDKLFLNCFICFIYFVVFRLNKVNPTPLFPSCLNNIHEPANVQSIQYMLDLISG